MHRRHARFGVDGTQSQVCNTTTNLIRVAANHLSIPAEQAIDISTKDALQLLARAEDSIPSPKARAKKQTLLRTRVVKEYGPRQSQSIGLLQKAGTLFNFTGPDDPPALQVIQFMGQQLTEHDGDSPQNTVFAARCIVAPASTLPDQRHVIHRAEITAPLQFHGGTPSTDHTETSERKRLPSQPKRSPG